MTARTPLVLEGNKAKPLNPADTVAGRASIQPITEADFLALETADVDVLYVTCATPPSGAAQQWEQLTRAEYDAIGTPDPDTMYVVKD